MFGGYITANPRFQEILKLDKMLKNANIPHVLDRNFDGWILYYPSAKERIMDAVEFRGSYGNYNDNLEIMGLLTPDEAMFDDVLGDLTAEDVFERIRKHYNGEWDEYIKSLATTITSDSITGTPMTPEEFATEMRKAQDKHDGDEECMHGAMDGIMCDLLRQLGYEEGVNIFEETPKWYA